jgi:hypothetical protein
LTLTLCSKASIVSKWSVRPWLIKLSVLSLKVASATTAAPPSSASVVHDKGTFAFTSIAAGPKPLSGYLAVWSSLLMLQIILANGACLVVISSSVAHRCVFVASSKKEKKKHKAVSDLY